MKPKVYLASKISRAPYLKDIREAWKGEIDFTCRWLDMVDMETSADPAQFAICWSVDEIDVKRADFLIVIPGEGWLRGALVEAGMALAWGKTVVLVGECADYGSWRYHPQVVNIDNTVNALYFVQGKYFPK